MNRKTRGNSYADAIDRVRSAHMDSISPGQSTVECPKCATKQVISEAPGMRKCVKCGFEFRPRNERQPFGSGMNR